MAGFTLKNLSKSYGALEVIKGIDLEVRDGEFIVFVGPSGCGKSTLLRMIAGLEEVSGGDLLIGEKRCNDIPAKARGIAMVFQSYALYPHKTVYENMSFGLKLAKRPKDEIDRKVRAAAGILHIEHLLERRPSQLSGGQRQRVAIGRAIVRDPQVFLFDEPLSNLDAALRVHMRLELAKLHGDLGTTMAYVTHDQIEAMTLADRIVVLDHGDVQQVGTPLELYHLPQNLFVAGFIGSPKMNFLEGAIDAVEADAIIVEVPGFARVSVPVRPASDTRSGDTVTIGIRPEHIDPAGDAGGFACAIEVAENIGDHAMLQLQGAGGQSLMVKASGDTFWSRGGAYPVTFQPDALHLFDDRGTAFSRVRRPKVLGGVDGFRSA
ncbi:ABC transporter ATP-binding protein [Martelella endophytica]|uniref:ABC transporter ATP-binding protein n=1 Tax=Martelella endophytica TaxID=1486262 RepID=UPI0005F14BAD|nr:sn-glycerol-3-phosphate ABC transporter ATP-binding protein UgpC [Martelella endophytica]